MNTMVDLDSILKEEILCPICKGEYCTETGDPKTLRCGHSLCTNCLDQLFQVDVPLECAECRYLVTIESTSEVPTSFTLKQIVLKLNEKKMAISNPKTINENLIIPEGETSGEILLLSMGTCTIHDSPLHFGCTACDEWLCGACVCFNHSGDKSCKVYKIEEALQRKKQQILADLEKRATSLQELKTNGKISKKTAEEFIEMTVKHISLSEKFLKEFSSKQLALVEDESYHNECEEMVSEYIKKLASVQTSAEIKDVVDAYKEKKTVIYKKKEDSNLFETWKCWMKDSLELLNITNNIYIKWKDYELCDYWTSISVEEKDVILRLLNEGDFPAEKDLVMEESFFSYSNKSHHAFIDIGNENVTLRLKFTLDKNPLGEEFMKRCCYLRNSFKGSKIYIPGRSSGSFCFGEKNASFSQIPKHVVIGDRKQYLKPIVPGAIGVFNNFENGETVDVNNMLIYINVDSESPALRNVSYISYDDEPRLKLCFGIVNEGYEELLNLADPIENQIHIKNCGVIID